MTTELERAYEVSSDAIIELEKAKKRDPKNEQLIKGLALTAIAAEEEVFRIEQTTEQHPQDLAITKISIASLMAEAGLTVEAVSTLQEAFKLSTFKKTKEFIEDEIKRILENASSA